MIMYMKMMKSAILLSTIQILFYVKAHLQKESKQWFHALLLIQRIAILDELFRRRNNCQQLQHSEMLLQFHPLSACILSFLINILYIVALLH